MRTPWIVVVLCLTACSSSATSTGASSAQTAETAEPITEEPARPPAAGPDSLEALLEQHSLTSAPIDRWTAAIEPLAGASVQWRLRSWGGEATSATFTTPDGPGPTERTRLISRTLGPDADLSAVGDAGHPVVVCLESGPGMGEVDVEATVWGVTSANGWITLWLRDCRIAAAQ